MVMPVPVISDRWWVVQTKSNKRIYRQSEGDVRELTWKQLDNSSEISISSKAEEMITDAVEVQFTQGGWFLIKLDEEHTLGEYYTWADPAGHVPPEATSIFISGQITNFFDSVDDYGEKELPCYR